MIPVILSGGAGTRLWPLSRELYPKQLLDLMHCGSTMIQATAERVQHLADPIVVCSESHRFMVAQQLAERGIHPDKLLLEPMARNTAPAVTIATLQAIAIDPDAIVVVLPADHHIRDLDVFHHALDTAIAGAKQGYLMTFGVVPERPETGFGYIKVARSEFQSDEVLEVEQFVEKPDSETAQNYLTSGNYFWNSGMFVFSGKTYIEELQKVHPNMIAQCQLALTEAREDLDFTRIKESHFAQCESISIDYALMEKSKKVALVSLDAGWSDIGNWDALTDALKHKGESNVFVGDVLAEDVSNSLIYSEQKLIAALGVKDLVVVETDDALLVAHRDRVQDIKAFPKKLKELKRSEYLHHRRVHRPWGSYDSIQNGERFQVKNLTVSPGASLSLQLHHHRAEHWVVVEGTAKVQIGEQEKILSENESVYIPVGTKHRLSNPGKIPLKIIEVQSGSYLGEDDIIRIEDDYHRDQ
ncbi:MAG: mannose-1-phosphate guanylyltransferase/mannose-6-phosphate isomerase [Aestuariibacter sp.]